MNNTRHIPFFKYQGTGNDFIIIDQTTTSYITARDQSLIEQMCDRRFGIGADGLMLITPSEARDFEMVYYNADGRVSSMCGNGGRCIVSLAARLSIISGSCIFDAIDGIHEARLDKNGIVALKMNDVKKVDRIDGAYVLDTGSPHYVRWEKEVDTLDMVALGKAVRYNPTFKDEGINVNIIEWKNEVLHVRTYERGVEDETLSCGTGVVAAAITSALDRSNHITQVSIRTKGGDLQVSFDRHNSGYTNVWLTGAATYVYEGTYCR